MTEKTGILGLGTAALGRPQYINIRQEELKPEFSLESFRRKGWLILDEAYQQGIRYFDTAPGYGMAEQLLMDWVLEKDDVNIEVATKWGYTYVANFDANAKVHEVKEHSLEKLNLQWAKSKRFLPIMTTYQIHSATFETGILNNERILNRLAELKSEYNLFIGLTTTGYNQMEVLKKALDIEVNGKELFQVFQITYNIFDQSLASIAEEITNQNRRIVIKEALANGRIFPNELYPQYAKAYTTLTNLAKKYKVGLDAIALRFCMDSIPVYKVLSGASNSQHLQANLKVNKFTLENEDIAALKELAISSEFYWEERKKLKWN